MLEPPRRIPKVLFIRNVFLHDCIEIGQSIESKLLDMEDNSVVAPVQKIYSGTPSGSMGNISQIYNTPSLTVNSSESLIDLTITCDYQKMPRVFESFETWPKSSNLHCWYCTNQFTGIPKFIPLVIEPNIHSRSDDKYIIEVDAICCRWSCGVSYINETTKDLTKAIEKINNLYFLYKLFTGKYPTYIPAAPNKYMQIKYGGDYTPEQYYKVYDILESQHNL